MLYNKTKASTSISQSNNTSQANCNRSNSKESIEVKQIILFSPKDKSKIQNRNNNLLMSGSKQNSKSLNKTDCTEKSVSIYQPNNSISKTSAKSKFRSPQSSPKNVLRIRKEVKEYSNRKDKNREYDLNSDLMLNSDIQLSDSFKKSNAQSKRFEISISQYSQQSQKEKIMQSQGQVKQKLIMGSVQLCTTDDNKDSFAEADCLLYGTDEFEDYTSQHIKEDSGSIHFSSNLIDSLLASERYLSSQKHRMEEVQDKLQTSNSLKQPIGSQELISDDNQHHSKASGKQSPVSKFFSCQTPMFQSKRGSKVTQVFQFPDQQSTHQQHQSLKKCRSPNREKDSFVLLLDSVYEQKSKLIATETSLINRIQKQKQVNQKKLKENYTDIANLSSIQRQLLLKIDLQQQKNDQLEDYIRQIQPQIAMFKEKLTEQKKSVDLDLYDISLRRQRIRTYVQSLQRDVQTQKEDFDILLEEDRDKISMAMKVCEQAIVVKKQLENTMRKASVTEKERDRSQSKKRGLLKRQIQTAFVCASVDLSKIDNNDRVSTPMRKRESSIDKGQFSSLSKCKQKLFM